MAINAATKTSDFVTGFIEPEWADAIFEKAARNSVVQQLVPRVPLGPSGTKIPVVTGRPSVGWVGEGEQKPASAGSMNLKSITPQKLAAIFVVSAEVARLNPGNFVNRMQDSFAEAFAVAFDRAALHDEGPDGTPAGGPFTTYLDQASKTQELGSTAQSDGGIYGDLNAALAQVVASSDASGRRYRLNGWALDDVVEPVINGSVDTAGHPLYAIEPFAETNPAVRAGRLIGRPVFMGEGVAATNLTSVVGYGGDFSQAAWGAIGGISYRLSTQASVTINGSLVSLFENNLIAVLAEAEYGFLMNDADAFIKLTNTNNTPVTSA